MTKQKLTNKLMLDAFNFYHKNFKKIFSQEEEKVLSQKLLSIVKYDYLNTNANLPYIIPQNTLYLIYFICEYKKAYIHSYKTNKPTNNLESLGKGNAKKQQEFKKNLADIYDENLDKEIRFEQFFKNMLLLLLKKPSYKKVSLLLLGLFYTQYPFLKPFFNEIYKDNNERLKAINSIEYTLEFFEYTNLSSGKILNSALILIYTVLTQNLNMNEDTAYNYAKTLVNTFINNKNDFPVDSFRQAHITKQDIYYAGIYNGIPIFQWYINEKEKYFKEKDRQKLKVIINLFIKGLASEDASNEATDLEAIISKEKSILETLNNFTNDKEIDTLINSVHIQFAKLPFTLLKYFP